MSTFLLVLGIYLVGALITWRIAYGRVYGPMYKTLAACTHCVNRTVDEDADLGCSAHRRKVSDSFQEVAWISLCWPFVVIGMIIFYMCVGTGKVGSRVLFPRGNRNRGYLAWTQAKNSLEYKNKALDLKWELRSLGIDPEVWMPDDPKLEPTYDLSPRQLESQGWALGRQLEEVSKALRQAKEITALKVGDDAKRLAIEATLLAPYRVKANVRPSESHQWHEEFRVSGSE